MNQIVTRGIVLRRIDYQEADRILTVLTPSHGKISLIAKGARRSKSKLAGGIELFSVSDITYIKGRKDISTLTSSRLRQHFPNITKDLDRTMAGYELLRRIDKIIESDVEDQAYFDLLQDGLEGLDIMNMSYQVADMWFSLHLLELTGHTPDFRQDNEDKPLQRDELYNFDYDLMRFVSHTAGRYNQQHIKFLRFAKQAGSPKKLSNLQVEQVIYEPCSQLVKHIVEHSLQV